MGRILKTLLATTALAVALAVPAWASSVRADYELAGTRVTLADGSGDANRLTIRVPAEAREIRFRDRASRIRPAGQRCTKVRSRAHRVDCPLEGELYFDVDVDTGSGDDEISSDVAQRYRSITTAFVRLSAGAGDDRIQTGRAEDEIDPGPGDDFVHAGGGYDFMIAGGAEDGSDRYDGGAQGGTISYVKRDAPVSVELDGLANDGAAGEGDDVIRAFGMTGGTAGDRLFGDRHANYLFGSSGGDHLRARGGQDAILGEEGSDRIYAGPGDDWVLDRGGPGRDLIDCGPGRDLYEADSRDTVVDCEVPLFGPRVERASRRVSVKR
jgi:Ca2+-binding RTX toxin-like protein